MKWCMKVCGLLWIAVFALVGYSPPQLWSQQLFVRGLCYSPFRDGQSPVTGVYPTRQEIVEDLVAETRAELEEAESGAMAATGVNGTIEAKDQS